MTPHRPLRAALLLAAAVFAAAVAVWLTAAPATAHAVLTGSTPGDGEVVATQPQRVTLSFSETVNLADDGLRVLDPEGERADTGTPSSTSTGQDGTARYAISLRTGLADGTYTVAWNVVSADSHPVSGAFTFSIGSTSTTTVDAAAQASGGKDGLTGLLYDIARYTAYGGFVLLAGAGTFILACWPAAAARRTAQRTLLTGWTTLTAATLALLLLRTPYTGSGRLGDALDLEGLADVVDTTAGIALVVRLLLLGAAAAFIAVLCGPYARLRATGTDGDSGGSGDTGDTGDTGDSAGRLADLTWGLVLGGGLVATGIACTWAMSEHASTGPQTDLAIPADVLHLLAVACWLGGLTTLLALLLREPGLPPAAVRRFSALALGSVAVLAATGLYAAWRQVRTLDALTSTDYGRLLLLKVALVAALLAAGWFSRRFTSRLGAARAPAPARDEAEPESEPVSDDPERARQLARQRAAVLTARRRKALDADPGRAGLRRTVAAEVALAAVVLAVTTALTATTPARTEAATEAEDSASSASETDSAVSGSASVRYDTGGEFGKGTAYLDLSPARTGSNSLHIRLTDSKGDPNGAVELRAALTLPAEDLGPLRYEDPDHVDVGHWTFTGLDLPRPGEWQIALTIRTSDVDQTTVTATVRVT